MSRMISELDGAIACFLKDYAEEDGKLGVFQKLFGSEFPTLDRCVGELFRQVEAVVAEADGNELAEGAAYMFRVGGAHKDERGVGLALIAIQRPLLARVKELTPKEAGELLALHRQIFPNRCCTPVMDDLKRKLELREKE